MKCILCHKVLGYRNKSGYCTKCYVHSPQYLEYQRQKQKEWYTKPKNKEKKRQYRKIPKVLTKYKIYQKEYAKKNIARLRIFKREWARKHRKLQPKGI